MYMYIYQGPFIGNCTCFKRFLKRLANAWHNSLIHWQVYLGLYGLKALGEFQLLRGLITPSFETTRFSINGTDLSSKRETSSS